MIGKRAAKQVIFSLPSNTAVKDAGVVPGMAPGKFIMDCDSDFHNGTLPLIPAMAKAQGYHQIDSSFVCPGWTTSS